MSSLIIISLLNPGSPLILLTHTDTHYLVMLTLSGCVLVVLDEPSQAEVGDLAHQIVSDEDVGCSQVTMDVVHPLDVRHPGSNLTTKTQVFRSAEKV